MRYAYVCALLLSPTLVAAQEINPQAFAQGIARAAMIDVFTANLKLGCEATVPKGAGRDDCVALAGEVGELSQLVRADTIRLALRDVEGRYDAAVIDANSRRRELRDAVRALQERYYRATAFVFNTAPERM